MSEDDKCFGKKKRQQGKKDGKLVWGVGIVLDRVSGKEDFSEK